MFFNSQERKRDFGLLAMRLGLAAMLLLHALPKLFAGQHLWQRVGTMVAFADIGLPSGLIGLVFLVLETLGGVSLVFGYLFRVSCTLLFAIFGAYCFNYYRIGTQTLMQWSLGLTAVYLGLICTGPGRYAIAVKLKKN